MAQIVQKNKPKTFLLQILMINCSLIFDNLLNCPQPSKLLALKLYNLGLSKNEPMAYVETAIKMNKFILSSIGMRFEFLMEKHLSMLARRKPNYSLDTRTQSSTEKFVELHKFLFLKPTIC